MQSSGVLGTTAAEMESGNMIGGCDEEQYFEKE